MERQQRLFDEPNRDDVLARLPFGREPLVRRTDPETSRDARPTDEQHDKRSRAVIEIMSDGRGRTDDEILADLRRAGYEYSKTSACHGRLTLQRMGLVIDSRERRRSRYGKECVVWQIVEGM